MNPLLTRRVKDDDYLVGREERGRFPGAYSPSTGLIFVGDMSEWHTCLFAVSSDYVIKLKVIKGDTRVYILLSEFGIPSSVASPDVIEHTLAEEYSDGNSTL